MKEGGAAWVLSGSWACEPIDNLGAGLVSVWARRSACSRRDARDELTPRCVCGFVS